MASGGAGALLLRAAALGGLTAAAWLLGGTTASADSEPPPPVEISIEVPTLPESPVLFESLALSEDPAAWARSFTAAVIEKNQPEKLVSPPVVTPPVVTKPEEQPQQEQPQEEDEGPTLDFSGGTQGNTRSGSISNEAPPEVIAAKAQVRAARKAAKLAAEAPPPPPAPPVVAVTRTVPPVFDLRLPAAPVKTEPAPVSDLNWSVPGPDAPLPAPPSAPVVTTASASSGHTDNSGGTRGVLAVLTSHNSLFPPTTWSVDERRDGTVPGSIPGLPATSPD